MSPLFCDMRVLSKKRVLTEAKQLLRRGLAVTFFCGFNMCNHCMRRVHLRWIAC